MRGAEAEESVVGRGLAMASLIAMPLLGLAKRRTGQRLNSPTLLAAIPAAAKRSALPEPLTVYRGIADLGATFGVARHDATALVEQVRRADGFMSASHEPCESLRWDLQQDGFILPGTRATA